jgi:hypothetical protein
VFVRLGDVITAEIADYTCPKRKTISVRVNFTDVNAASRECPRRARRVMLKAATFGSACAVPELCERSGRSIAKVVISAYVRGVVRHRILRQKELSITTPVFSASVLAAGRGDSKLTSLPPIERSVHGGGAVTATKEYQ